MGRSPGAYRSEKRSKELARRKKQEAKQQQRRARAVPTTTEAPPPALEPQEIPITRMPSI